MVVAARFCDVNLTGGGPGTVGFGDGEHPDCRPKPVSGWQSGGYFDAAVFDLRTSLGVDATRFHRWNNCAGGGVCDCYAGIKFLGGAGAGRCEVDDVV